VIYWDFIYITSFSSRAAHLGISALGVYYHKSIWRIDKMNTGIKVLALTNPIVWPVAIGVLAAIILKNLFGGVAKDCVKVVSTIE
jgi:hypothetical protein